ncbi:MAG: PD-(D/E)XK nuclease family protein [Eubacteriales bacterium]|nr:PD-(D/E)XK nuclease family protein [Eubacteriales bacterium]MDD3198044.1 PD-(D/E)XK nuclease family protein [Eubacteriales bacterium]MDD3503363.1 PD-(D/E)XK nuclease family protein [Eubacteriales bacterium]
MGKMTLLYGDHRQALLDSCLEQIAKHSDLWPDRRAFLIVPETMKADTERRYIEQFGNKGMMMAEVLSFRRLAHRLFSESGGLAVNYISPAGRTMLIQSVIRKNHSKLKKFGRYAERPGYAAEIDSVVGDFRRYGLEPEDLDMAAAQSEDELMTVKLTDLAEIYRQCNKILSESNLIDRETDLDRLSVLIKTNAPRLEFLNSTSVWICGFGESRDFTGQEYGVIEALFDQVSEMTITVCAERIPANIEDASNGPLQFIPGRQCARRLLGNHEAQIIKIPSNRSPAFETLAGWWITDKKPAADQLSNSINLIRAEDKKQELMYIAGEIRRLISDENYRYRDIAVAVCDLPAWQFSLRTVFREFELENFIDMEIPLSGTSLMRFVSGLLQLGSSGDRFETLMAVLRTGLTGASHEETDGFENYCLARALPMHGRYRHDRYYSDKLPGYEIAINYKHQFVDPLMDFCRRLSSPASADERAGLLENFLIEESEVKDTVECLAGRWDKQGEHHAASALVQAWNYLLRLLAELKYVFQNQFIGLETFSSIINAGISGAGSRIIPTGLDRIRIGDVAHISQHTSKILFIAGAFRNNFPAARNSEGILLNRERQRLEEISGKHFPDLKRYHFTGRANEAFKLITSPLDKLYLSCPSLQDSPSVYQQRLMDLIGQETILKNDDSKIDVRWNSLIRAERLCSSVHNLTANSANRREVPDIVAIRKALELRGWCDVPASVDNEPLLPAVPEKMSVPEKLLFERYPAEIKTSVSRLQKFRECPYAHYAAYLLGLSERDYGVRDARSTGSLLHALAEQAFADLTRQLHVIRDTNPEKIREVYNDWLSSLDYEYIDKLYRLEIANDKYPLILPGEEAGQGRIIRRLAQASLRAAASEIGPEHYLPWLQEWSFPSVNSSGLTLPLKDRKLILRGIIDRIDISSDRQHCRIIDYKSGNMQVDPDAVYHGFQLQLPVYLLAFLRNNPNYEPGDMGYFRFNRPELSITDRLSAPDERMVENYLAEQDWSHMSGRSPESLKITANYAGFKAARTAEEIFTGNISARPTSVDESRLSCQWCSYKVLCNYDDRCAKQRQEILRKIELPDSYPGIAEMKPAEKRKVRLDYIEQLMQEYVDKEATKVL